MCLLEKGRSVGRWEPWICAILEPQRGRKGPVHRALAVALPFGGLPFAVPLLSPV